MGGSRSRLGVLSLVLALLACQGVFSWAARAPGAPRELTFFFSAEAWGGTPFSVEEKQLAMGRALLRGGFERLEQPVAHLAVSPETPEARVRSFVAIFEVDASVRPPRIRTGYELELLVPDAPEPLAVELVNGVTGVTNIVQIAPDGAL
ncbi:hypothetical protein [Truepera radiovictrix]|uniref:Lipoprotein n=1 Tax=Truepera radiovictrix (strain DSM 17093 / CIP 108686 / LMG 22925 / RQ-24) TaxID=649638 RepID=D7CU26_TRURR|nr:hypothetical protein [Truepera radiovictrix]ADI13924.1 hypothetical protein Trad_0790 [Truepera radiovictrix DSM 17093]WMT57511.1 hypothetical protein RCV51_00880 [Truepera radiovictrix]